MKKLSQSLENILSKRFTLKDLIVKDKITNERKSLKDIILEMEDEVLANAGVDIFEEAFNLIFTKLYDEYLSQQDKGIINYFLRQVTKIAVQEPDPPSSLDEQDYNALKEAVSGIDDEDFRVMEFKNTGQTNFELKNKIRN